MLNTISMIGLGYIGLPTATLFASHKKKVIGVDINQHVIDTINQGKIHIIEPDLDRLVHAVVTEGYLRATKTPEPADAFLIAVPTPFTDDHKPDLSYIEASAKAIAPVLKQGNLVILESTSPVGTTEKLAQWLAMARPDITFPQQAGEAADVQIAHCPERVLPGHVVQELVTNDRVIGGMTDKATAMAIKLYQTFVKGALVPTNARTAEMCKLTENSFRDVNIAFANEISMICDRQNIDVRELINLANRHPRVNILQPGCGVGGHCIAVDPWFIIASNPEDARIIRTAREVNDAKPHWIVRKAQVAIEEVIEGGVEQDKIKIICLGLTFKPDIDDLRESPALEITHALARKYPGQVSAVEPNIDRVPNYLTELGVELVGLDDALVDGDVLVLLVDHAQFKQCIPSLADHQKLVDSKGLWKR